jgi:hypothetical protein
MFRRAMPTHSSEPAQSDPLQRSLEDAESELRRRLHEACIAEAKGLPTDSTREIRRLEDALLAAADAAKQTITARHRITHHTRESPITIKEASGREAKPESQAEDAIDDSMVDQPDTRVREFTDAVGHPWRAWPVIPRLSRATPSGRSFLGDFQDGWICFESLDSTARRRFPRRQAGWGNLTDDELRSLLEQAINAPARETQRTDKQPNDD